MLSKIRPIGIMFYGNSEINIVPWETIIKLYRDMEIKNFDTLKEYANHFISFLTGEGNPFYDTMFPSMGQEATFSMLIDRKFRAIAFEVDKRSKAVIQRDGKIKRTELRKIAGRVIQESYDKSTKMKNLETIPEKYDEELIIKCEKTIMESKESVLKNLPISKKALNQLRTISCNIITKNSFSFLRSGIVIAGFGDKEIFPSLVSYTG